MRQLFLFVTALVLCLSGGFASGQEITATPPFATPFETMPMFDVNVREGPGTTFGTVARLRGGVRVNIIERNSIGTWVRVQQTLQDGSIFLDGWVLSGFMRLSPDLRFSEVPVSPLPDAEPANAESPSLRLLYEAPVIAPVSESLTDIYRRGLEMGHYTHVVTKIGDSVSADPLYLTVWSRPGADVTPYDYLQDALNYFGASTQVESVATRIGLNTYSVFDSTWSPPELCERGESPIECEFRRKQPSIALILFGPNDVRGMDTVTYEQQMRRLIETSIENGVIPVLSTFSYSPGLGTWAQAVAFNTKLLELAAEYQVPIINLWLAARALPEFGLEVDGIHMKHWGSNLLEFDNGYPAYSGANLRNLLALRMVDEIRRNIFLDSTAAG